MGAPIVVQEPQLRWAQRKAKLLISIDLIECRDVEVQLFAEGRLSFKGTVTTNSNGVVGEQTHALELDLLHHIDPADSSHQSKTHSIDLIVAKADTQADFWERLTKSDARNNKIKVNHERWVEQDEEEEAEQQERLTKLKEEFQQEDLAKEEDDFSAEMFAIFRQAWLVLFNTCCSLGWLFVAGSLALGIGLTDGLDGGWNAVATPVVVLVVVGWVEVAHAATGLTKSSTRFIFFGNFPRAVALLVVPLAGGDVHGSPVITVMFAAWAAAELIRAPFYVANELGVLPGWLKLLRYTAFVVLSPARPHGIVCSLAVQLRCLIGSGAVVLQAALAAELYIFYAAALVEETRLDRFMAEQALLPANTPGLEHLQLRYILAVFAPVSVYCAAGVYRHNLRLRRQILSKGKGKAKSQ